MPLVRRTRATLRSAEFGFLGVVVYTRVHTPRRWGLPLSAGVLVLLSLSSRPLRTSCWIVGTRSPSSLSCGFVLWPSYGFVLVAPFCSDPRGRVCCPGRAPPRNRGTDWVGGSRDLHPHGRAGGPGFPQARGRNLPGPARKRKETVTR